jgi:hypothetical protein
MNVRHFSKHSTTSSYYNTFRGNHYSHQSSKTDNFLILEFVIKLLILLYNGPVSPNNSAYNFFKKTVSITQISPL